MHKIIELPFVEESDSCFFGSSTKGRRTTIGIPIQQIREITEYLDENKKPCTRIDADHYEYEIDLPISEIIKRINSL